MPDKFINGVLNPFIATKIHYHNQINLVDQNLKL